MLSANIAVVAVAIATAVVLQRTNEDFRFQVATTHNSLADLQKRIWTAIESTIISGVVRTYIHTWQHAVVIAAQDSGRAVRSCSVLAYLTLRPVVWLLYLCGRGLLYAFYEYILVRGIFSPTAVNHQSPIRRVCTCVAPMAKSSWCGSFL